MSRFFAKFGFTHRRLWDRDGLYRAALLFGPAPLVGVVAACGVWALVQTVWVSAAQLAPWAKLQAPEHWSTGPDQAQTVEPTRPLPPVGADGGLVGYEPGWKVTTNPIQISLPLDVDVKPTPLTGFLLDGGRIDLARIIAEGPKNALYIGVGQGFLAARTAGVYALSIHVERPAGQVADCLMRLALGPRRIVSNEDVDSVGDVAKTFEAARFDLRPGLYPLGWAFGCWHDQAVIGPGRMTVLIARPGEQSLQPARPDDIVRPERIKP
jgi:hypothetical protein